MTKTDEADINENTRIKLGFVIAILAGAMSLVGVGTGTIWWAASMQSKMDAAVQALNNLTVQVGRVSVIQVAIDDLQKNGTTTEKELRAQVQDLRQRFEIHLVQHSQEPARKPSN